MSIEEFLSNIDQTELDKEVQQKEKFIQEQHAKIINELEEKISTIILVKKRKLQYEAYNEAAERLKVFSVSAKNLIQIYFNLLQDEEKILLLNFSDIKDLISKFRFCLFRSIHNMNRMLIKQSETSSKQLNSSNVQPAAQEKKTANKKKKRKKGKNSKMLIQQTGGMYKWILQNFQNPYPSQEQKQKLSADSKISISKVNYWFINMRQRTIKKLMSGEGTDSKKKKHERGMNQNEYNSEYDESCQESVEEESN